jgi:hypothetical protein
VGAPIRCTAALITAIIVLAGGAGTAAAHTRVPTRQVFQPRVGRAMGLMPALGHSLDVATGVSIPVVYHGGPVMDTGTVTVHTIFWAPSGYAFDGSPAAGVAGYVPLVQQFFADAAHDSGSHSNIFSLLNQYGDNARPGVYSLAYNAAQDTVLDTDPYPASSGQCPSPGGIATCLTDQDVTKEIDKVIQAHDPSGYGLHDVWEVFLPPNVDECSSLGVCGTSQFAGYHSLADAGHGMFIYAIVIDTLIEQPPIAGADPQGNPEAENSIDTAAHETFEALTNPEGDGWMDPNGFETADKCENGPQTGNPLGYAPDGSPYDQLIGGHEYNIQEIWSNSAKGCEQSSTVTSDGLPLPVISLRQFSAHVSGNIETRTAGVGVRVLLVRAGQFIAEGAAVTRKSGAWGPVALRGPHGAVHGLGDDRDELLIAYGHGGPQPDVIATGSGGNPFTEAGWTNWFDLDTGFELAPNAIALAPCGQIGVLTLRINGRASTPPVPQCQTELDASVVRLKHLDGHSQVLLTSEDNRAVSELAPNGALVRMTVSLGEPGSAPVLQNNNIPFLPSGIPTCTADLRLGTVACTGLVPDNRYSLARHRGRVVREAVADGQGEVRIANLPGPHPLAGGDRLTLRNGAGRALTVLHVAKLRAAINGDETVLAGGSCQPGDYWGAAPTSVPSSSSVGQPGATGLGTVCPSNGSARGLSDTLIAQTDDLSGGVTETSVPLLEGEAPSQDATVYGNFKALAQTGVPGAHGAVDPAAASVSLSVTRDGSKRVVWHAGNVAGDGVVVHGLSSGVYDATWVVRDRNGDTRTQHTTFIEGGRAV